MMRPCIFVAALCASLSGTSAITGPVLSGSEFLSPELKTQAADDAANPGMLWVALGAKLWDTPQGETGKACATCHDRAEESMRGVATRYPAADGRSGKLFNLELRINACRRDQQRASPYAYESEELLALTAFVAHQSRGLPMAVQTDGPAAPFHEAGRRFFYRRQGQLNLSCAQCHEDNAGRHLRGDVISHGVGNGYPAYRLEWQTLGSLHRRLRACSLGVRAIQFAYGSPEYLSLELYLAGRANGLPVETPALRR